MAKTRKYGRGGSRKKRRGGMRTIRRSNDPTRVRTRTLIEIKRSADRHKLNRQGHRLNKIHGYGAQPSRFFDDHMGGWKRKTRRGGTGPLAPYPAAHLVPFSTTLRGGR